MKYTLTIECETAEGLAQIAHLLGGKVNIPDPEDCDFAPAKEEPVAVVDGVEVYSSGKVETAQGETPTDADENAEETPSIDDVRAAMVAYTKANSRDAAIELLSQFVGAGEKPVLSNVPEENYGALIAAAAT